MSPVTTWKELRADVARLHEELATSLERANDAVLNPPDARRLDRIYVDAYADLRDEIAGITARAERLVEMLAESPEPEPVGRPLEAVLADIRAEGHTCVEVFTAVYHGRPYSKCVSNLPSPERDSQDKRPFSEWAAEVERGEASVESDDLAAAAAARLEQIRELHGRPRYIVEVDPDAGPTYFVLDTRPQHLGLAPGQKAIVFSAPAEGDAVLIRDRLNAGGSAEAVPDTFDNLIGPEETDTADEAGLYAQAAEESRA